MMDAAYSSEDCEIFAQALAQAWAQLLDGGRSPDEALDKGALSHGIFKAARLGERAPQVLAAYALAHLEDSKNEIVAERHDGVKPSG